MAYRRPYRAHWHYLVRTRGTRFRWVTGMYMHVKALNIPKRAYRCAPINMDAVLVDVRRIRRAKRSAHREMLRRGFEKCPGCRKWIDPDTCGCGDAITHNAFNWGHMPVPLGCDCMRDLSERTLKSIEDAAIKPLVYHGYGSIRIEGRPALQAAEYRWQQGPTVVDADEWYD